MYVPYTVRILISKLLISCQYLCPFEGPKLSPEKGVLFGVKRCSQVSKTRTPLLQRIPICFSPLSQPHLGRGKYLFPDGKFIRAGRSEEKWSAPVFFFFPPFLNGHPHIFRPSTTTPRNMWTSHTEKRTYLFSECLIEASQYPFPETFSSDLSFSLGWCSGGESAPATYTTLPSEKKRRWWALGSAFSSFDPHQHFSSIFRGCCPRVKKQKHDFPRRFFFPFFTAFLLFFLFVCLKEIWDRGVAVPLFSGLVSDLHFEILTTLCKIIVLFFP